jgi:hypothetical protein
MNLLPSKTIPLSFYNYNNIKFTVAWLILIVLSLITLTFSIFIPWYILVPGLLYALTLITVLLKFEWGVYLLIFLVPIYSGNVGFKISPLTEKLILFLTFVDRISIATPIIIFSFLGFILSLWSKINKGHSKNPLSLPILLFLLYAFITLSYVPSIEHSGVQLFILTTNIILFFLFVKVISDETIHRKAMWYCLISGVFHALLLISFYFIGKFKHFSFEYPITQNISFIYDFSGGFQAPMDLLPKRGETFTFHNELALIFNVFLAIALGLFLTEKNLFRKRIIIFSIPVLIATNSLIMSRGGTVSLILLIFFLSFSIKKLRRNFIIVITTLLILTALIGQIETMLLNHAIGETESQGIVFQQRMAGGATKGLSFSRLWLWQAALEKLVSENKTFFGLGIGGMQYYLNAPYSHNLYLSFLIDFGLIGLGLLFWIIIVLLNKFLRLLKYQISSIQIMCIAFMGALLCIGTHGLIDFEYNRPFIWFTFGLAISTLNLAKKELSKSQQD